MQSRKIIAIIAACVLITSVVCCGSGYGVYVAQKDVKYAEAELLKTQESYQLEVDKSTKLQNELTKTKKELKTTSADLDAANVIIADLKDQEYKLVYLGDYKITHYCTEKRAHICGTGTGKTATGTTVTAGRSIAVDPSVIPYGSQVYIAGYGWRTAEDCGAWVDGGHIDVAVSTHAEADSMGTKYKDVWMLVKV